MRRPDALRCTLAGTVLLAMAGIVGMLFDLRVFLAAWLAAWWFCAGVVMGACVSLWMHRLTGGRWGEVLRPAAASLVQRRAWLGLLALPIALGLGTIYPWAREGADVFSHLDEPDFVQAWFGPPAFGVRAVLYLAVWFWLSGSALRPGISRHRAAASLAAHALIGSLASVDLLMSLVPGWRSTGFALRVLVSQALGGAAALVLLTCAQAPRSLRAPAAHDVPVARDLGNLLLMYVLTWAYLAFMQFLIIWAENLPDEISWYVPRLQTGWFGVAVALLALQLVVPVGALVMRSIKDRPRGLGAVAALLLFAHALDVVWLVLPSVDPHALAGWWLAPLCIAGMALLVFAPAIAPVGELPAASDVDTASMRDDRDATEVPRGRG